MAKAAEQAIQAVGNVQVEGRRYGDDGRAKVTDEQSDRLSYLGNLDSLARPLLRQAGLLRQARQTVEDCSDWIVEVVNKSVLQSDIYRGIANLDAEIGRAHV